MNHKIRKAINSLILRAPGLNGATVVGVFDEASPIIVRALLLSSEELHIWGWLRLGLEEFLSSQTLCQLRVEVWSCEFSLYKDVNALIPCFECVGILPLPCLIK